MSVAPVVSSGPAAVWSIIQGHTRYWVTNAAVRLGVFAALQGGGRTVEELAVALSARPAQLGVLLDSLVGAGLLDRTGEAYCLTETSADHLVPGRERYMGDLVLHSPGRHDNWPLLAETVQSGTPPFPVDEDVRFWRDISAAAFGTQLGIARATAQLAGLAGDAALRILDLGAGAAPWAVALLQSLPNATAVANDLPGVADLARDSARVHGVAERLAVQEGDFQLTGFPPASFDVVVLANVVRTEGDECAPRLLLRAAGWLKPGGSLLVADYFLDEDRRSALTAMLLGATMMANTRRGRTFTVSRHRRWLRDAGLDAVEVLQPLPAAQVLLARRAEVRHG
jgi:ubiquinone/menaquinone biosynthesis C-methylase UbiE/DNA-binding transcriptional ArsR family regulator